MKILFYLQLFASAILLKAGAALIPAIFADALNAQIEKEKTKRITPLEITPTFRESMHGLIAREEIGSPKMMAMPNLAFFVTSPGMRADEAYIRSQVFAFDELPIIPGKFIYLKPGYWVDC
jgi:hypothetical protein